MFRMRLLRHAARMRFIASRVAPAAPAAAAVVAAAYAYPQPANALASTKPPPATSPQPLGRYSAADAVERVLPSVLDVRVTVQRESRFSRSTALTASMGSGFVIGTQNGDALVLTNEHVVSEAASKARPGIQAKITVTSANGERYAAELLAADATSDIAILRVPKALELSPVQTADPSSVRMGEFVVAVGSPISLANSCSFGVVSSNNRSLAAVKASTSGISYLQTDLATNSGSSGAPLCDLDGKVIGICSMKVMGGVEGISFAIPIDYALKVVNELLEYGAVRRPYLGLILISLTPDVIQDIETDQSYRMPQWIRKEVSKSTNEFTSLGLIVHDITAKSPADNCGLRKGDVIVAVDGVRIRSTAEFIGEMTFKVGSKIYVEYRQSTTGKLKSVYVTPETLDD